MKVLGHDHIAGNNELVLYLDFFENLKEEILAARRLQKLAAVIATTGNEVEFTAAMKSLESFRHANNIMQAS